MGKVKKVEENIDEESNRKLIILIMILVGVGFICLACQQFEDETKISNLQDQVSILTAKKSQANNLVSPSKNQLIAAKKSSDSDELDYKIELTSNGNLVVNTKSINDRVAASGVLKAVKVSYGSNAVCDNMIIIAIKNNGTISAFNLGDSSCDYEKAEINYYNDLDQFKNVVDAYDTIEFSPLKYHIVIQKSDYSTEDITQYFERY